MHLIIPWSDQATTFLQDAVNKKFEKVIILFTSENKKEFSKELKENLQNSFSLDIQFYLDVKNQKETKISLFDGFCQLGTRKSSFIPGIYAVYDNERETEKDFIHQRRGGMNHILLKEMEKYDIELWFRVDSLTPRILGRLEQNMKLAKKFAVRRELVYFVFNSVPAKADIQAFWNILQ